MMRLLSRTFTWVALATLPICAAFLLWGAPLLSLFGTSFAISRSVVAWLAVSQLIVAVFGPLGWALSMTGRHLLELGALACGLVLATVLCLLLIPAWGQLGAAVATFTAIAVTNLLRVICVRRSFGAMPFDTGLLFIMAAGIGIVLGARLLLDQLPLSGFWKAALGSVCFLVCYGAVCRNYLRSGFSAIRSHAFAGQG